MVQEKCNKFVWKLTEAVSLWQVLWAGRMVVCQCHSWKLGELFGTIDVVNSDSFGHRKSCTRDSILVTLTQFKTNRLTRKGVQTGYDMGTALQKGETNGVWVFNILTLGTYQVIVSFNILANGNLDIWFKIRVCRETGRRCGSVVERCLNKADTNSTLWSADVVAVIKCILEPRDNLHQWFVIHKVCSNKHWQSSK